MPNTLAAPENDTHNTKIFAKCSLQTWQGTCLADTLSRVFLQDGDKLLEEKFEVSVLSTIAMPDLQLQKQKEITNSKTHSYDHKWLASKQKRCS